MSNLIKNNIFISSIGLIIFWVLSNNPSLGMNILDANQDIINSWFWAISTIGILAILFGILGLFFFGHNPIAGKAVVLISMVLFFCTGGMYIAFLILNEKYSIQILIIPFYLISWPILLIPSHICDIAAKD